MVATFLLNQELAVPSGGAPRDVSVAAHELVDPILRAWVAEVGERSPLQTLSVLQGPGLEVDRTGWILQVSCVNADEAGRSNYYLGWLHDLTNMRLTLGCSRALTLAPPGYADFQVTGDNTSYFDAYSSRTYARWAVGVFSSLQEGAEWFALTLSQDSTGSRISSFVICRCTVTGTWLLLPATTLMQHFYCQLPIAPFTLLPLTAWADRVNHRQLQVPATFWPNHVASGGPKLLPGFTAPEDIGITLATTSLGMTLAFPDGSLWLTLCRGLAIRMRGPTP